MCNVMHPRSYVSNIHHSRIVKLPLEAVSKDCNSNLKIRVAAANFFPVTIESIPVHRKHHKFPPDPDFQVAVAVSILRVRNIWQEVKLMNIPPDSELDSNSET